mgnify:CR=1 FL=1
MRVKTPEIPGYVDLLVDRRESACMEGSDTYKVIADLVNCLISIRSNLVRISLGDNQGYSNAEEYARYVLDKMETDKVGLGPI